MMTLVLILVWGSGTASVTLPNYPTATACVSAGKVAEQNYLVKGWICVPSPSR